MEIIISAIIAALVSWMLCAARSRSILQTQHAKVAAAEAALAAEKLISSEREEKLTAVETIRNQLTAELIQAKAALEIEHQRAAERTTALQQIEQQFKDSFARLSSEALHSNNEQFLQLARSQIERQQIQTESSMNAQQQAISSLLAPLSDALAQQQHSISQLENSRQHAYGSIQEQISRMTSDQQHLRAETANLVNALRQPKVRGRWGELQLQQVVEQAGMHEHCDFCLQQTHSDDEGNIQRPDMLVRLPNRRVIVVDAKVPLVAYLEALEAADEDMRKSRLQAHAQHLRAHIDAMSKRNYHASLSDAYNFTVIFVPGEVFYSAALEQDHELLDYAMRKNIILTSPTTLIGLLKAVALGWRETRMAENAEQIRKIGEELYKRISVLAAHFAKVGENLNKTVDYYNKAVGSMEQNLLTSARRMHELDMGDKPVTKSVEITLSPRSFTKPELTSALSLQ